MDEQVARLRLGAGLLVLGITFEGYEQKQRMGEQHVFDGLVRLQVMSVRRRQRGVCDSFVVEYDSVRRTRSAPP
jgi:hypothetical protein